MESDLKRWSYIWHQPKKAASDEEYRGQKSSMAFAPSGRQRLKHDQRRIIHFKLALGLKKQP